MKQKQLLFFFLLAFAVGLSFCPAQNFDINLLRSINLERPQCLDPTFKFLTKTATPVSIGLPLAYLILGGINRDRAKLNLSWKTGVTISAAMTVSTILKFAINRTRPYQAYSDIQHLSTDFTPSFPSGHTTSAFCTATTLSLIYPKWYVIIPSYTWASLVAYSRLHLGMHYPLDVLGGIILGVGTSYLSYRLLNKYK